MVFDRHAHSTHTVKRVPPPNPVNDPFSSDQASITPHEPPPPTKSHDPRTNRPRTRIACFLITVACLLSGVALTAQSVGSGVITGRIFNPATGQYLRNAEIRVVATGQAVTSGNEGDFEFRRWPRVRPSWL